MNTTPIRLKKDDQVQVISGKEKGKTGKIIKVDAKNTRVFVEKLNMVKRHVKPSQQYPQGGILEKEQSLHISNVLLYCGKCGRGRRFGIKMVEKKGSKKAAGNSVAKTRVCKTCGESLEAAKA